MRMLNTHLEVISDYLKKNRQGFTSYKISYIDLIMNFNF